MIETKVFVIDRSTLSRDSVTLARFVTEGWSVAAQFQEAQTWIVIAKRRTFWWQRRKRKKESVKAVPKGSAVYRA